MHPVDAAWSGLATRCSALPLGRAGVPLDAAAELQLRMVRADAVDGMATALLTGVCARVAASTTACLLKTGAG